MLFCVYYTTSQRLRPGELQWFHMGFTSCTNTWVNCSVLYLFFLVISRALTDNIRMNHNPYMNIYSAIQDQITKLSCVLHSVNLTEATPMLKPQLTCPLGFKPVSTKHKNLNSCHSEHESSSAAFWLL